MTYGLSVSNPSGRLTLSSEALGYKYLGTPTLISAGYKIAIGSGGSINPYIYSMTIPAGVSYPIVGVRLYNSTIVSLSHIVTQSQPNTLTFIIGLGGVRRSVDTATGAIYLDAYTPTGARLIGQNYGLLYVRNMGIYEGEKLQLRLYDTGSGYKACYLNGTNQDGASVTMIPMTSNLTTAFIFVESVLRSPDPKVFSNVTFTAPILYMFCPYVNSDGASGYGLNLYSSTGDLTFSSNQTPMVVATIAEFFPALSATKATTSAWTDYGASLYDNGQTAYSLQYNSSTNNYSTGPVTASTVVPIALLGNSAGGYVQGTRAGSGQIQFTMAFGLSLDSSGYCIRIPYMKNKGDNTFDSNTDSMSLYTGAKTSTIIVNGNNL
jgi:hypothetical protein